MYAAVTFTRILIEINSKYTNYKGMLVFLILIITNSFQREFNLFFFNFFAVLKKKTTTYIILAYYTVYSYMPMFCN